MATNTQKIISEILETLNSLSGVWLPYRVLVSGWRDNYDYVR